MGRYEIIQEIFIPCTGEQMPEQCHIEERSLVSPERYVRGLYKDQRNISYLHTMQGSSLIYEVVFDAGGKHRYTFTPLS